MQTEAVVRLKKKPEITTVQVHLVLPFQREKAMSF